MGRTLTNNAQLNFSVETTLGTQPTSGWKVLEPTTIGKYGPSLKSISREPISRSRQRRKGSIVDLDSSVEFELDTTYDHVKLLVEGLLFASAKSTTTLTITAVTSTGYTVAAGGDIADDILFFVRGLTTPANNGLKVSAGTSTATEVKATGTVAEAAPTGARLEICGVKGATADLTITAGGNLASTILNFTTHAAFTNLTVGQFIFIGNGVAATNSFAVAANNGLARVTKIAAALLTLDKKSAAFSTDAGTGKSVYILLGSYIRNVSADSADYIERSLHFELVYENLGASAGDDMYEYSKGNFTNEITFDFSLTSKSTMKCSFIGTDTTAPTAVRATGAASAIPVVATAMFNTSVDLLRLRVTDHDEGGFTTYFKSASISIKNNVSPEKVLGLLGARFMNAGLLDVMADCKILFTDANVLAAIRANTTCTMELCGRNEDGAFIIDIQSMCLEGGDREFPVNETVNISFKTMAFADARLGSCVGISTFPYMPST